DYPAAAVLLGGSPGSSSLPGFSTPATEGVQNRFEWSSGVLGVVWSRGDPDGTRTQMRAWRSDFDAAADWIAGEAFTRLDSERTDFGLEGLVEGTFAAGRANAGLRIERADVRYRV